MPRPRPPSCMPRHSCETLKSASRPPRAKCSSNPGWRPSWGGSLTHPTSTRTMARCAWCFCCVLPLLHIAFVAWCFCYMSPLSDGACVAWCFCRWVANQHSVLCRWVFHIVHVAQSINTVCYGAPMYSTPHDATAQGRARLADALQQRRVMEQELHAAKERAEALELQLQEERGRVRCCVTIYYITMYPAFIGQRVGCSMCTYVDTS